MTKLQQQQQTSKETKMKIYDEVGSAHVET